MSEQHFVHKTGGRTCSRAVYFDIKDGKVTNIRFDGGCRGNTQGVARLAEGMDAEEVVKRLKGMYGQDQKRTEFPRSGRL